MILYLVMLPVFAMMFFSWRQLRALQKHDAVLFRMCQIRRDLMDVLRHESDTIADDDYRFARLMLNSVSSSIGLYRDHRRRLFNFHAFMEFVERYQLSAEESKSLEPTGHEKLEVIHKRYQQTIWRAFVEYTPLFRWTLAIRLVAVGANAALYFLKGVTAEQVKELKGFASDILSRREEFPRHTMEFSIR